MEDCQFGHLIKTSADRLWSVRYMITLCECDIAQHTGLKQEEDDMTSNYNFLIDVAYAFLCTGLVGHCGLVILVHYDT